MVRFIDAVRKHIAGRRKAPEPQPSEEPKKDPVKARTTEQTDAEYRPRAAKDTMASSRPRRRPARPAAQAEAPPRRQREDEGRSRTAGPAQDAAGDETPPKPRRQRNRRRRKPRPETEVGPPTASAAPAPKPPAEPWDPASFQVEPMEGKQRFHDFDLPDEIMHAIADLGFQYCTPIQAAILPSLCRAATPPDAPRPAPGRPRPS